MADSALYPHDCSAECSERAVYEITFDYPPFGPWPREQGRMGACEAHREAIVRAAVAGAWRGEIRYRLIDS